MNDNMPTLATLALLGSFNQESVKRRELSLRILTNAYGNGTLRLLGSEIDAWLRSKLTSVPCDLPKEVQNTLEAWLVCRYAVTEQAIEETPDWLVLVNSLCRGKDVLTFREPDLVFSYSDNLYEKGMAAVHAALPTEQSAEKRESEKGENA